MEDSEILVLFWERQEQALSELERKYGTRLKRLASRMVSEEDAEECVNVSFVYEEREYDEDGNRWMMASLMDGAVYYELCSIYYPKDYERAKEIMLQWCEQF